MIDFLATLLIVLLVADSIASVLIARDLYLTSHFELKTRALGGDKIAKKAYRLRARGYRFFVLLALSTLIEIVLVTLLLESYWPSLFVFIFVPIALTFIYAVAVAKFRGYGLKIAGKLAGGYEKLDTICAPITKPLGSLLDKSFGEDKTIIYSKNQLYKIFSEHHASPYSEIEEQEIEIVKHALEFGDKQIREVMTPRRMMKLVSVSDTVGPHLMDELNKSGHSRFPVFDTEQENIVGTLFLRDLVNAKTGGSVKNIMSLDAYFVNEELPLAHALQAFIKTRHHQFLVVNNFAEVVGLISIEDVVEQIIGKQIVDEFDRYDDLRAVAELHAKKQKLPPPKFNKPKAD